MSEIDTRDFSAKIYALPESAQRPIRAIMQESSDMKRWTDVKRKPKKRYIRYRIQSGMPKKDAP